MRKKKIKGHINYLPQIIWLKSLWFKPRSNFSFKGYRFRLTPIYINTKECPCSQSQKFLTWTAPPDTQKPVTFSIAAVQGWQRVYIPRFLPWPWPTPLPHQSSQITSPSGKDVVESKAFWGPVCYSYSGMPKTQIYCLCFIASQPFLQLSLYFFLVQLQSRPPYLLQGLS